jgi:hypothetical protein
MMLLTRAVASATVFFCLPPFRAAELAFDLYADLQATLR